GEEVDLIILVVGKPVWIAAEKVEPNGDRPITRIGTVVLSHLWVVGALACATDLNAILVPSPAGIVVRARSEHHEPAAVGEVFPEHGEDEPPLDPVKEEARVGHELAGIEVVGRETKERICTNRVTSVRDAGCLVEHGDAVVLHLHAKELIHRDRGITWRDEGAALVHAIEVPDSAGRKDTLT